MAIKNIYKTTRKIQDQDKNPQQVRKHKQLITNLMHGSKDMRMLTGIHSQTQTPTKSNVAGKKKGNPRYSLVLGVSRSQTVSMHFTLKGLIESLENAPLKTSGRQQNEFDQTTAKLETRNLNARCY